MKIINLVAYCEDDVHLDLYPQYLDAEQPNGRSNNSILCSNDLNLPKMHLKILKEHLWVAVNVFDMLRLCNLQQTHLFQR